MAKNKSVENDGLYSFPSEFASNEEKADETYGVQYARGMWYEANNFNNNFYTRQERIVELRNWAEGQQSINHLKDAYVGAGDTSYANLNFNVSHPIPKLVNALTNDLTSREYDVVVSAIDRLSKDEKDKELNQRLAAVKIKRILDQQEAEGIDVSAARKEFSKEIDFSKVPDTEDDVYFDMELNYKSPFEEAIEGAIDWVFDKNNIGRISETIARDLAVVKTGGCDVFLDEYNDIKLDDVDVKNVITSYCKKPDYSDARYVGVIMEMPMSQLRAMAGDKFTDAEYFQMAKNWGDKLGNRKWTYGSYFGQNETTFSDWQDFKVLVNRFEFKTAEKKTYKYKKSRRDRKYLDRVSNDYQLKEKENGELLSSQKICIYQGWHIVDTDYIFGYKKKPNMLRTKDKPEDTEFNITLYSPNMLDMKNKSLVEKMIPFAEEMIILELKMQHIVSTLRPDGVVIDMSAISGITSGQGGRWLTYRDLQQIYDQTGNIYIKSTRADGQPTVAANVNPVTPIGNNHGLQKLEVLMGAYNGYMEKMYSVTGFNPSMDGSIPEKGSLVGISELNIKGYNNAVKHLYDAYTNIIGRIAAKVGLMIQDKIQRGEDVKAYKKALGNRYVSIIELAGDYSMTELGMRVEYRPTILEQQDILEALKIGIEQGMIGSSSYLRVKDIARINIAQAERYIKKEEERFQQMQMQKEQAMMEQNRITQIESPKAAAEAKANELTVEYTLKSELSKQEHEQKMLELKLQHGILKQQDTITKGAVDMELLEKTQEGDDVYEPNESKVDSKVRKKDAGSKANSKVPSATPRITPRPADDTANRIGA